MIMKKTMFFASVVASMAVLSGAWAAEQTSGIAATSYVAEYVKDGTLTVNVNGTPTVFSANSADSKTVDINIPDAPVVDNALSAESTNAVQNKVVTAALAEKVDEEDLYSYQQVADRVTYEAHINDLYADRNQDLLYPSYAAVKEIAREATKVDTELSDTSVNAVQNKVITAALDDKLDVPGNGLTPDSILGVSADGVLVTGKVYNADISDSANIDQEKVAGQLPTGTGGVATTLAADVNYLNTNKITSAQATTIANNAIATVTEPGGTINPNGQVDGLLKTDADGNVIVVEGLHSVTSGMLAPNVVSSQEIADGAVTAAKTSGVIGKIPFGSQTSTTYATIWVQ